MNDENGSKVIRISTAGGDSAHLFAEAINDQMRNRRILQSWNLACYVRDGKQYDVIMAIFLEATNGQTHG